MKRFIFILIAFVGFSAISQQSDFNTIDFKKTDSISELYNYTALKNLPVLAHNLTFHLDSDVEKFRAIYKWVCLNIEGDYCFYLKTTRKRKKFKNDSLDFTNWNKSLQKKVFKQLVDNQKTICSGYAYLIKELAALSGIECEIVNGYSRSPSSQIGELGVANHSWNAVKLNNKWYLVDATLASGYFNVNENQFVKNYNDGYFLASPEQFSKSHFPLDSKWLLLDDKPRADEFVNGPIVYGSSFKYNILPIFPQNLKNEILKNDYVVFKLKVFDENDIEEIELIITKGSSSKAIKLVDYKYEDGLLEFKHQFNKKGSFDVHLKKGNDILASYSVIVEKEKKILI
ncbi:transglutaminase domain-containing protein [Algibacter sp. L1A34]|uniref:transglutaminase domain-containing protein n=1 Tax=Algibacter sp. L1A34 TaxID=2686365 RepID=UPI00131E8BEE|nr:transglutaminase domain-containing protein [Algibacter sp. L1A34]